MRCCFIIVLGRLGEGLGGFLGDFGWVLEVWKGLEKAYYFESERRKMRKFLFEGVGLAAWRWAL